MSSASFLPLVICVIVVICGCGSVSAKPTIYVKNDNDKLEPVLVAVSSTVIPLPVYRVSYGVDVKGAKLPAPGKPPGDIKLITVPKKKGSGKVIKGEDREEVKKQKDQL